MNTHTFFSKCIVPVQRSWRTIVLTYAGRNPAASASVWSRQFYDAIGSMYDWLYIGGMYRYREAVQYVVERCIESGDSVLDAGCGTGYMTELAAQKGAWVVGADFSLGMVRYAKKNHGKQPNLTFLVGDCRHLPLRCKFDKIVTGFMMVILNERDQLLVMQNFRTILNPNGEVIFLTASDLGNERKRMNPKSQWRSIQSWCDTARESGFQRVEIEDFMEPYRLVRMIAPD